VLVFFDFHTCFFYRPLAIISAYCCMRLLHLQTSLLCP
jgi:hypothetical protein